MGRQDTTLTVDMQKMLEGVLGNDYSDNVSGDVLSEHAGRLQLLGFTVEDSKTQDWVDRFWKRKKFSDIQNRVHHNAIRDGNFCVMVEYDYENERIVVHREQWWDGIKGVFIGYDTYGQMLYAVKEWETPTGRRRTVYYNGAMERYISSGAGNIWFPFILPSDSLIDGISKTSTGIQPLGAQSVAIPYLDEEGKPLHIPYVHFANVGDEFENYGMSILDGGLLGAQDQINDIQYDISAGARHNAFQRTTSCGYKLKVIKGRTVLPKSGPGVHYHANEENAKWGVLAAGDMSQLISTYWLKVQSFYRNSGTPFVSITGNWPSGEAIFKLEQVIRQKTIERQSRFTPAWEEVMHRCIELANVFDRAGLNEDATISAIYKDAGDRDPLSLAMADLSFWQAAAAAVSAGCPIETFLRTQGWTEEQLQGFATDIKTSVATRETIKLGDTKAIHNDPGVSKGKGSNTKPNNAPGNKLSHSGS
jgi:hypothetical protein